MEHKHITKTAPSKEAYVKESYAKEAYVQKVYVKEAYVKEAYVDEQYVEKVPHGTPDFPLQIHYTTNLKSLSLYAHLHKEFEFLVLTKGCGYFEINGTRHYLKEGDGIFVNSYQLHLANNPEEQDCEFFSIVFSPDLISTLPGSLVASKYVYPIINGYVSFGQHLSLNNPWQAALLNKLHDIEKLYSAHAAGFELKIISELMGIWHMAISHAVKLTPESVRRNEFMQKAMEYIATNFGEPITAHNVADHVGICTDHLCRVFQTTIGLTTSEYLTKYRIKKSCELLTSTALPITEIAYACGFQGTSYFNRSFKKICNSTPFKFRKDNTTSIVYADDRANDMK